MGFEGKGIVVFPSSSSTSGPLVFFLVQPGLQLKLIYLFPPGPSEVLLFRLWLFLRRSKRWGSVGPNPGPLKLLGLFSSSSSKRGLLTCLRYAPESIPHHSRSLGSQRACPRAVPLLAVLLEVPLQAGPLRPCMRVRRLSPPATELPPLSRSSIFVS